ncbi:MAG: tRNA (guanine(26)-N(2))-dimethyltransferase [Candidatus Nanoarchaeia archaeon]
MKINKTDVIKIKEGALSFYIPNPQKYKLDTSAPVFYNPIGKVSRDITILLLKALKNKPKSAVDLLAATGIRGLRIIKEAKIKNTYINDANPIAAAFIRKNAALNKLKPKIYNLRAHEFLAIRYKLKDKKFDYLDIDPFGTPVPFLDASIKAIKEKGGVLAVTATDTAVLCGTYPLTCIRRYGAKPLRNYLMHEMGIRILIKKIQEIGMQYDLALIPIFSHVTAHYMRTYLISEASIKSANKILNKHGFFKTAGPLWLGDLWDESLAERMYSLAVRDETICNETKKLLQLIKEEAKISTVGFYDMSEAKLHQMPPLNQVIEKIKEKNYLAAKTHFRPNGIRTNMDENQFKRMVKLIK